MLTNLYRIKLARLAAILLGFAVTKHLTTSLMWAQLYLQKPMSKAPDDPKRQALRQSGTLNPRPQDVHDKLFREKEFFDARDLLQVKYEMLRRVNQEGHSISQAAASFGFSRPSFYQAQSAFETGGLAGLVPQKRGPKQGHKLTTEILEFLRKARADDADVRTADLVQRVQERFGVELHSRTIERGLLRGQKKRR